MRFRYAPSPCQKREKKAGIQGIRCIPPSRGFDDPGQRGVPLQLKGKCAKFEPTTRGAVVYRDTTH